MRIKRLVKSFNLPMIIVGGKENTLATVRVSACYFRCFRKYEIIL